MKELDPPAIVRTVDAEMEQLAYEATSALDAAKKAAKNTLERYRDAGSALIKAKERCKHGQWLPWLTQQGIHLRIAAKSIRIAANWDKLDPGSNLNGALEFLARGEEEKEKKPPREPGDETEDEEEEGDEEEAPVMCERCSRIGKSVPGCEDCKTANAGPARNGRKGKVGKGGKGGKETFDWKVFEKQFQPVAQSIVKVADAYPEERNSLDFKRCEDLLTEFLKRWEAWKSRLTRSKE